MLLTEIIRYLELKQVIDPPTTNEEILINHIEKIAKSVLSFIKTASDADIYEKFGRKFGEGGVKEYTDNLCEIINKDFNDFGSEEFKQRLVQRSDERISQTHKDVIKLSQDILVYVIDVLKKHYGITEEKSGEKAYWEKGIESVPTKEEAYKRQLAATADKKLPKEAYLDILDLMHIIRQKNNWPLFENVFNIPLSGEKGKTYYLDWMKTFNEIRKIPAHPSPTRAYDEQDYEFMKFIKYEFYQRRNKALGIQDEE